jgi:transposase
MDRGMVSEANLEWLLEGGRRYLVGTPRSELRKWERELIEKDGWNDVRDGLEVKICPGPDGEEAFLLCRSQDRQTKERAMHERFSKRIEQGLESLGRRLKNARRAADRSQAERQLGRLLERNRRAAGAFTIEIKDDPKRASGLRLEWKIKKEWSAWAQLTEGTYILRSNVTDWSAEELWRTYIQLSQAEAAFRIQKSDLKIRPIWHQKQERVLAHIFVCFLAYVLWKTLSQLCSKAGLGDEPRRVLDELSQIQSMDVVLPTRGGPEIRTRCVSRPTDHQQILLDQLGLKLPSKIIQKQM